MSIDIPSTSMHVLAHHSKSPGLLNTHRTCTPKWYARTCSIDQPTFFTYPWTYPACPQTSPTHPSTHPAQLRMSPVCGFSMSTDVPSRSTWVLSIVAVVISVNLNFHDSSCFQNCKKCLYFRPNVSERCNCSRIAKVGSRSGLYQLGVPGSRYQRVHDHI